MSIVFGINSSDLEATAASLTDALGVKLNARDSSFRGGSYYLAEVEQGQIILQTNCDFPEEESFESAWPIKQLILYLHGEEKTFHSLIEQMKAAKSLTFTRLSPTPKDITQST